MSSFASSTGEITTWSGAEEQLEIEGGYPLSGEVVVSGSKNAMLPLLSACLLTGDAVRLRNVPALQDTHTMLRLLSGLGATVSTEGSTVNIQCDRVDGRAAEYKLVKRMRASILVLGPLLGRFGEARVALPGGCAIGPRPVDLHLKGMQTLGASITIENGEVVARAARLKGARIVLDIASVGATENLLMAAACAEGETEIVNAAQEPEIGALCRLLQQMGVKIEGIDSGRLRIEGRRDMRGADIEVLPDRIESGTWLFATAATGGDVFVRGAVAEHLDVPIEHLRAMGIMVEARSDGIRVAAHGRPRASDFRTYPYPGYPTDLQSQAMAVLARAAGTSRITETVFENRFQHAGELVRLGAKITVDGSVAHVEGVEHLEGAPVEASDLRAGAGLVIAGLMARGKTTVGGLIHLDRGYENLVQKLSGLGARVRRTAVTEDFV